MKKIYSFLFVAVTATSIMVSCDDDDNDTGGKISSLSYYDIDGQRVKAVGSSYRFSYDEKGNLESYYADGDYYDIQLKPFKLVREKSNSTDEYEIKFNSKGLISQVVNKYTYTSSSESESETATYEISYNGNNQVSNVAISINGKETYKEEKSSWTETGTISFSYSGTVLKKVTQKSTEIEDGEKTNCAYTLTFRYNNDYENPFLQYTPNYAEEVFDDECGGLALIGMFGNASSVLPDYIDYEETEDDYSHSGSERCSYSFNSNGSIESADGYTYSYTTVSTRSIEEMVQEYTGEKKARKSFGLFKHHHHRK